MHLFSSCVAYWLIFSLISLSLWCFLLLLFLLLLLLISIYQLWQFKMGSKQCSISETSLSPKFQPTATTKDILRMIKHLLWTKPQVEVCVYVCVGCAYMCERATGKQPVTLAIAGSVSGCRCRLCSAWNNHVKGQWKILSFDSCLVKKRRNFCSFRPWCSLLVQKREGKCRCLSPLSALSAQVFCFFYRSGPFTLSPHVSPMNTQSGPLPCFFISKEVFEMQCFLLRCQFNCNFH